MFGAGELGDGNGESHAVEVVIGGEGRGTANIEDGVGVLLGLEEGERGSCLLFGGERSGGVWGED